MINQSRSGEFLTLEQGAVIQPLSLTLSVYGKGLRYLPEKFQAIRNRQHVKPFGGLWGSPVGSAYGWREWCQAEEWGDLSTCFTVEYTGNTLVIDRIADLAHLPWQDYPRDYGPYDTGFSWPDYEKLLSDGVDAVYLTERGQGETRFTDPGLYGYDCECVLVMNPNCLKGG